MLRFRLALGLGGLLLGACAHNDATAGGTAAVPRDIAALSTWMAQHMIIADGHVDAPHRMQAAKKSGRPLDLSQRQADGNFDFVRARSGGLDAPFMSIYVESKLQKEGDPKAEADGLIDLVEAMVAAAPEKFVMARSPDDVARAQAQGKVALPMGIENGAALVGDLANVKHFYDRGVRYITLTHAKDNRLCDSSYDETRTHGGLSEFGRQAVVEMNRQGIMVDVSHVSDDTIRQVLAVSQVPVIASHSSARHFTPGLERNISDALIRGVADRGGVILVNFGAYFLSEAGNDYYSRMWKAGRDFRKNNGILDHLDPRYTAFKADFVKENPPPRITADTVLDHIDHIAEVAGVAHVGFGSDFDGVGDSLPEGLKDVSAYPVLIEGLLRRGYTAAEIEQIASGNLFRVWRETEAYARAVRSKDATAARSSGQPRPGA